MAEAAAAPQLDTDLPKAVIKRIVKTKLDALGEGNIQLHKDATLALAESAKVLINFLTVTSNDICKEKKRQTISADDVLQALEDLDFSDMVAPLQVALDGARRRAAGRARTAALLTLTHRLAEGCLLGQRPGGRGRSSRRLKAEQGPPPKVRPARPCCCRPAPCARSVPAGYQGEEQEAGRGH
jgi:histone H3/H4